MIVGTTENMIPFYVRNGFTKYYKTVKNFFGDNYQEKIYDGNLQCIDMYYYSKEFENMAYINFDGNKGLQSIFDYDFDINRINDIYKKTAAGVSYVVKSDGTIVAGVYTDKYYFELEGSGTGNFKLTKALPNLIGLIFMGGLVAKITKNYFDRKKGTITIIYQIVGASTLDLSQKNEGDYLADFVGPLGTPSLLDENKKICIVGGGVGCAIAMPVADKLCEMGADVTSIIGFRNKV